MKTILAFAEQNRNEYAFAPYLKEIVIAGWSALEQTRQKQITQEFIAATGADVLTDYFRNPGAELPSKTQILNSCEMIDMIFTWVGNNQDE